MSEKISLDSSESLFLIVVTYSVSFRRCSRLKSCIPTNLFLKRLRLIIVNSHAKDLSC